MYVPGYGLGSRVTLSHGAVTLELTRDQFNGVGYLRQPIPETHRQVLGYTPRGSAIVGGGRRLRWKFLFDLILTLSQWERLVALWGQQQSTAQPVTLVDEVWGFDGRSSFQVWIPYPPLEIEGSRRVGGSPMPCKGQVMLRCAFEALEVGADE
jgi:hypothetical protein